MSCWLHGDARRMWETSQGWLTGTKGFSKWRKRRENLSWEVNDLLRSQSNGENLSSQGCLMRLKQFQLLEMFSFYYAQICLCGTLMGVYPSQQIFIICYGLVSSVSHLHSFGCQEPVRAPCSHDVWFNEHNKKDLRSFKHRHRKTWFCAGRQGGKAQQRRGAMTESLRRMEQRLRKEGEGLVVQRQAK